MRLLDISVVSYAPDRKILSQTLSSVAKALVSFSLEEVKVFLVDNGPGSNVSLLRECALQLIEVGYDIEILSGHGNIGYGPAHDFAIMSDGARYHLVLNPDVTLEENALRAGLDFLTAHPDVVLAAPRMVSPGGHYLASCKRLPSIFTFFLRGFAPESMRRLFHWRLEYFEMTDQIGPETTEPVLDVPATTGAFMLMRKDMAQAVGGFGDRYFLYFEDFDLSIRLSQMGGVAYLPQMRIVHEGGNTARKGWRHLGYFLRSAFTFFNRHGWRW